MYSTNASMTKFHHCRVTYNPEKRWIDIAKLAEKYKIAARANIPITRTETIDMRLYVTKGGKQDFTMQYRNNLRGITIRCDNAHSRPHIDKELPGARQEKRWLDKIPKDYEEAINIILTNAEEYNPRIGAMYWIMSPLLSSSDNKVELLEKMRISHGIKTPLSTLARIVDVYLVNKTHKRKNLRLKHDETIELFDKRCAEIAELERREKGPLTVEQLSYRQGIVVFPFTIFRPFSAQFDYGDYPFTGKITKDGLVGMEYEMK